MREDCETFPSHEPSDANKCTRIDNLFVVRESHRVRAVPPSSPLLPALNYTHH